MKFKSHSLMLGYREFEGRLGRDEHGKVVVIIDELGAVPSLEYIKQGFRLVEASDQERERMKAAGYSP